MTIDKKLLGVNISMSPSLLIETSKVDVAWNFMICVIDCSKLKLGCPVTEIIISIFV